MYSAVLLMALSGGADVVDGHHHRRDNCGCGGMPVGCVGYVAPAGCCPQPVNCGCNGGRHGLFHRHRNGCNGGCVGGCIGYGGCVGTSVGCGGGAYGPGMYGPGPGMYGPGYGPGAPGDMKKPMPGGKTPEPIPAPGGKEEVSLPATLIINLPANANLTVDGHATTSTSTTRVFVTPALEAGQEYAYNLTATVSVNGQIVTQTQRVAVLPGRQTQYTFAFPSGSAAARR